MSVYEALQRARRAESNPVPLRRPARPRVEAEAPPVTLAPGPIAAALAPLLAAVRPLLDSTQGAILQFVAATAGEGASTVAREFAFLAATTGRRRTLLLDGDRRDPSSARALGSNKEHGLSDALRGEADGAKVLHLVPGTQLTVARLIGERGPTTVDAETVREIYTSLREHYDLIVVDCPPVTSDSFTDLLPDAADGIVLVIEAEHTRPVVISHAKTLVQQAGGKLIGAVLNKRTNYIPDFLYRLL